MFQFWPDIIAVLLQTMILSENLVVMRPRTDWLGWAPSHLFSVLSDVNSSDLMAAQHTARLTAGPRVMTG